MCGGTSCTSAASGIARRPGPRHWRRSAGHCLEAKPQRVRPRIRRVAASTVDQIALVGCCARRTYPTAYVRRIPANTGDYRMPASASLRQSKRTNQEGTMFRTLTGMQKGAIFYVITLGLAVLVALFGPTGTDAIQTINMFSATAGVLLMLLVVTPDGYHRAGWAQLGLHRAGFRYWPVALLAPMAVLVASYGVAT